jgi:X-X-X-Leu-X-X-Gly heptad repeat protein
MALRNLRIGARLNIGFGAVLGIMLVLAFGATWLGKKSRDDFAAVTSAASAKQLMAADMKALLLEQSAVMRNIGLHPDVPSMKIEAERSRRLAKEYGEARGRMKFLSPETKTREMLESLDRSDQWIEKKFAQVLELSTGNKKDDAAYILMSEIDPRVQKALFDLNGLIEAQKKASEEAVAEATVAGDRMASTVYVVEFVVLALAVLVAWTIKGSIVGPIADAVAVARRVASGDLTSKIEVEGRDEAAELLTALREMNNRLGQMVTQIRSGAESIAVGAGQVAAGNQQLSSRTEEHASSLEETASTLEEFTATVRQNAERAGAANELAASVSNSAHEGGVMVGKVVQTMQEVSASSRRISDIIGVIDGISFQTNILALNAAVEAARAGEQGRGFAVVASEVRSLAHRSAASSKEIRGLIENSVGRIEVGAKLVGEAGRTMDALVSSVRQVATIMTEIASASREQSSGIEQINKAITQMDTVVQMNASLVEEATAAATSMASQATGLAHSVAQFRVNDEGSAAAGELVAASGNSFLLGVSSRLG